MRAVAVIGKPSRNKRARETWIGCFRVIVSTGMRSPCVQIIEETEEKAADRLLFGFLTLISKLIKECNILHFTKPSETLSKIWSKYCIQSNIVVITKILKELEN